jgi:hypothetical protein
MEYLLREPIVLVALSVAMTPAALAWSIRQVQVSERSTWSLAFTALPGLLALRIMARD